MSTEEGDDPAASDPKASSVRDLARQRAVEARRRPVPPSPEREYPQMRALLSRADDVPYGLEDPISPAVPETFIPRRPPRARSSASERADEMLSSMAEGLLLGGEEGGPPEMRITLRDDFFRGTELRIRMEGGQVHANLLPPDLETYRTLEREVHRLREQLEARGLRVGTVSVDKP